MHVSAHRGLVTPQIVSRTPSRLEVDSTAIRPVFERPEDKRRQGDIWRRPRQPAARDRGEDARSAADTPTASEASASPGTARSEFWTLLGAVVPDAQAGGAPSLPRAKGRAPSFDELLAQIAAVP